MMLALGTTGCKGSNNIIINIFIFLSLSAYISAVILFVRQVTPCGNKEGSQQFWAEINRSSLHWS